MPGKSRYEGQQTARNLDEANRCEHIHEWSQETGGKYHTTGRTVISEDGKTTTNTSKAPAQMGTDDLCDCRIAKISICGSRNSDLIDKLRVVSH
jgi:hypothetical protein